MSSPFRAWFPILFAAAIFSISAIGAPRDKDIDRRVNELLLQMTLDEKIGQMTQVDSAALAGNEGDVSKYFLSSVLSGGSSDPTGGDNSPQSWLQFTTKFEARPCKSG